MPGAMQLVNQRIYNEWLPENDIFELVSNTEVQWYGKGFTIDARVLL